jgi:hypothetical protein
MKLCLLVHSDSHSKHQTKRFFSSIIPHVSGLDWISSWFNIKLSCTFNVLFIFLGIQQVFYKRKNNTAGLLDLHWFQGCLLQPVLHENLQGLEGPQKNEI